jgi:hypothetical protein
MHWSGAAKREFEEYTMILPEAVKQKVLAHLKKYLGRCPVCGRDQFAVTDNLMSLPEYGLGVIGLGGTVILPVVTLTCTTCGNILSFNAVKLGIIEPGTGKLLE